MPEIRIWAEDGAVEWLATTAMQKRSGARYVHETRWAWTVEGAESIGQQLLDAAAEARKQRKDPSR